MKRLLFTLFLIGATSCSGNAPAATPVPTVTPIPIQPTIANTQAAAINAPEIAATRTPLPSLTPEGGIASATPIPVTSAATVRPVTLAPSATSALIAMASPTLPPNISPTPSTTPLSVQPGSPPPFTVDLPTGWNFTYTLIPINDLAGTITANVAAYTGVVAGGSGRGYILVMWNFPTIVPISPLAVPTNVKDIQDQSSFSDGYRLLRGSILDESCAVNIYGRNYFKIGGRDGLGQIYQTSGCLDNRPDLIGWYAGIWEGGKQYMFYAYVEPPQAYNNGQADLQAILNSVKFQNLPVAPTQNQTPIIVPTNATLSPRTATPLLAATPAPPTPTLELN